MQGYANSSRGATPMPGITDPPAAPSRSSGLGLVQALRVLGLPPREARMYLALVRAPLGAREASEIAGLHRATGYRVLVRLIDRGMVTGNGRTPQSFLSVAPRLLFQRLEQSLRDEAEIVALMADAFVPQEEVPAGPAPAFPLPDARPRFLYGAGRVNHGALSELAEAKTSAAIVVPPLSTPVSYRIGLARTIGRLARQGVHIRLVTDATPADYRFARALLREAGDLKNPIQVRHFCPLETHLYGIDRRRVVRVPVLGAPNRNAPVGILLEDVSRVRTQMARFEALWAEAGGTIIPPRQTRGMAWRSHADRVEPNGRAVPYSA
jgi:hypothetical protein